MHENDNYSFFDYVVNIDGIQYVLPAMVDKFIDNGWEVVEDGELDPGDIENIKLKKENAKIDVVIKNYDSHISNYEDSYVCGLEVNESCTQSGLEFQIPMNISIDSSEEEIEKWIGQYYILKFYRTEGNEYIIVDDLYFKERYGYTIRVENHVVTSIEINYQPDISDRKEKGEVLTKWSGDSVVDVESEVMKQINFDTIYQVDIDGDGQKDQVNFKYLDLNYDNGTLLSIVNGNVNLLRMDTNIRSSSMIVRENGTCAVIFSVDEIDNYSPCIIYQPHKSRCKKVWEDPGFVISDTLTNQSLRLKAYYDVVGAGWISETDYNIDENYSLVRAGNSKLTDTHGRKGIKTIKTLPVKLISGEGTVTESELEPGTELQFLETDYQSMLKFKTSDGNEGYIEFEVGRYEEGCYFYINGEILTNYFDESTLIFAG
uniref:hypothetical protein n=1 Tax=Enterocloster clostridioformis TaxID=1531 RepID=UPI0025A503C7|nr:hypothetical protein [Enterocloster clostridioformis]